MVKQALVRGDLTMDERLVVQHIKFCRADGKFPTAWDIAEWMAEKPPAYARGWNSTLVCQWRRDNMVRRLVRMRLRGLVDWKEGDGQSLRVVPSWA